MRYHIAKHITAMLGLGLVLLASSCGSGGISAVEYMRWVEDPENGLNQRVQQGEILFESQYKPLEYLALKEAGTNNITKASVLRERNEFSGLQYFTLRLKTLDGSDALKKNLPSMDEYYKRVEYLNSLVKYDVLLLEGQDTLACRLHHFERTYGAAPYISLVLGFESSQTDIPEDKEIVFYDRMYSASEIRLSHPKSQLEKIPELKILMHGNS